MITVNNSGKNTTECCVEARCSCSSLYGALHSITSDTIVNITSESVLLEDNVYIGVGLDNVTITGNGAMVMCNNKGSVSWKLGDNILIEGITLDQCGNPMYPNAPAIEFDKVFRISILNCTFQHSKVCKTISISVEGDGAYIYIVNSTFLLNKVENTSACQDTYSSLIIQNNQYVSVEANSLNFSIIIENSVISSNEILGILLYNNVSNSYIAFNNVTVFNNSQGGVNILSTKSYMILDMLSSHFNQNNNGALVLNMSRDSLINFNDVTFIRNEASYDSQSVALYVITHCNSIIHLLHCNFEQNIAKNGDSIVYIAAQDQTFGLNITVLMNSSRFVNNQLGSALHLSHVMLTFDGSSLFNNNSAEAGAAIYVDKNALITASDKSLVQFVNNAALLRGGAIYSDLTNCFDNGILFGYLPNFNSITFIDNSARFSGNSIYFNIPKSCVDVERDYTKNNSVAYIPYKLKYMQSRNITGPAITASPYWINLCSSHECGLTNENCFIAERKMLGQLISFSATVCDYFNAIAETVQFRINCVNCDTKYRLVNNEILVNSKLSNKISILATGAHNDVINDTNITLELSSVLSDNYKEFSARLSFTLSACYSGFLFNNVSQKCECYNSGSDDIVQCQGDHAEIKLGYWYGIIFNKHTTSLCPIGYCDFNHRTKARSNYYTLPKAVDDQCSLHRTGVVCSDCKSGYTLAYDSFDCVDVNQCSPGMTVLVIALTFLYWIVIVAVLFGLTYYFGNQVSSGYFNGLIYFYSITEVLLVNNLYITDGVFYTVAISSSFAKLAPKYLGKLCITKGLDAIDQQFIHYIHAVCISFILIGIIITAKYFNKVAFYVRHCIGRITILFLVLSYTSVTSISLQLLRGVQYDDNDSVFVYLSPRLKYFTYRHAIYAVVALLCGLVVIGLPFVLLSEPFLRKKTIFNKIRSVLDQFQDGYKDKYKWFAAYYLLCRLVIILIAYFGNSDYNNMVYYMQTACAIIVINHICFWPYKKHVLNVLDTAILLTTLLIVNLNNVDFTESTTSGLIYTLLFIPLLLLFGIGFTKPVRALKMKWKIFNVTPMIRR